MPGTKADIIAQLRKEILPLEGFRYALHDADLDEKLKEITAAFPGNSFPLGVMHEFISAGSEDATVTAGFVSALIASLMNKGAPAIWIGPAQTIFPPSLKAFGIAPDKIIFIHLQKEKEILWATEEALKCEGLAAVVVQLKELSFTGSRRLQLAVEKSKVTGFVLRHRPRSLNITACHTRWKITSLPTSINNALPGIGFPRWHVALLKARNGRPNHWKVELVQGKFRQVYETRDIQQVQPAQTG